MASIGLALLTALAAASTPALAPRPSAAPAVPAKAPPKAPAAAPAAAAATPPDSANSADPFATSGPNGERPLSISIDSGISVGRLGLTGRKDGTAEIDPQTGAKQVGANMVDLGGLTFQGTATITGQPFKPVRIELPQTVTLYSQSGAQAELSGLRTDLAGVAMLDAGGQLKFNFGAKITSKDGQGGNFRGHIPISVEYY